MSDMHKKFYFLLIKSLNNDNIYLIFDPQGVMSQVKLG